MLEFNITKLILLCRVTFEYFIRQLHSDYIISSDYIIPIIQVLLPSCENFREFILKIKMSSIFIKEKLTSLRNLRLKDITRYVILINQIYTHILILRCVYRLSSSIMRVIRVVALALKTSFSFASKRCCKGFRQSIANMKITWYTSIAEWSVTHNTHIDRCACQWDSINCSLPARIMQAPLSALLSLSIEIYMTRGSVSTELDLIPIRFDNYTSRNIYVKCRRK